MNDERHFYVIAGSNTERYALELMSKAGITYSVELGEFFGYFREKTGEVVNRYTITESDCKKVANYIRKTRSSK